MKRKTVSVHTAPPCELPEELAFLWMWFNEIAGGVNGNGFGPPVISWTDIKAWAEVMDVDLMPWEARTLVQLGNLRASILAEKAKENPT